MVFPKSDTKSLDIRFGNVWWTYVRLGRIMIKVLECERHDLASRTRERRAEQRLHGDRTRHEDVVEHVRHDATAHLGKVLSRVPLLTGQVVRRLSGERVEDRLVLALGKHC